MTDDHHTMTAPALARLSQVEYARLATLEDTISRGLHTFIEVGQALMEVRDARLYRAAHKKVEDYCKRRWQMARSTAYQLIDAAAVVQNVRNCGHRREVMHLSNEATWTPEFTRAVKGYPLPENEAQTRPLTRLEPEQQQEAWQRAVETAPRNDAGEPRITAAIVEDAVREVEGKPRLAIHFSSATDMWSTPQALFDVLDKEFGFTLDVCASKSNAKCERYFTEEDNGLAHPWEGVCWMNPPYGDVIGDWIEAAHEASKYGATVVCLVPARTDTGWWWDHCIHGEVRFLKGRLKFGEATTSAPFPSAVVVFRPQGLARVVWWEWQAP